MDEQPAGSSGGTQRYRTSNPYEKRFGYSRAVRRGQLIFVSGTTSIDERGEVQDATSAKRQAVAVFAEIIKAVTALGGTKDDIVRVRMFVAFDEDTDDIGEAFKTALGDVAPAATMIVGARFVKDSMNVEIEADAVVL